MNCFSKPVSQENADQWSRWLFHPLCAGEPTGLKSLPSSRSRSKTALFQVQDRGLSRRMESSSGCPLARLTSHPQVLSLPGESCMDTYAFTSLSRHSRSTIYNRWRTVMVLEHKVGAWGRGKDTPSAPTHHAPGRGGPPGVPGPRSAGEGCGSWPWPGCASGAGSSGTRRPTWRRLLAPGPQTGRVAVHEDTPLCLGLGERGNASG